MDRAEGSNGQAPHYTAFDISTITALPEKVFTQLLVILQDRMVSNTAIVNRSRAAGVDTSEAHERNE